jgi:hypothetical protein
MTDQNGVMKQVDASVANAPKARSPRAARSRADGAFNAFLSDLDLRGTSERSQAFQPGLAASPDARVQIFLSRLHDPRFARHSLPAIARTCDISFAEFVQFCRTAAVEHARFRAIMALTDLGNDMFADALSRQVVCPRCDGLGRVPADKFAVAVLSESDPAALATSGGTITRTCPMCDGRGSLREPGDAHARRLILKLAGLLDYRPPEPVTVRIPDDLCLGANSYLNSLTIDIA